MNIFSICIYTLSTYTVISTEQTDLGLRSRTFTLKSNKLITFSEISQVWQCLKIVFIYTSNDVLKLRYRPNYPK